MKMTVEIHWWWDENENEMECTTGDRKVSVPVLSKIDKMSDPNHGRRDIYRQAVCRETEGKEGGVRVHRRNQLQ
jgi:predicted RNA-binding Zn-ribbon protein involved in translation (DUF1610 family)